MKDGWAMAWKPTESDKHIPSWLKNNNKRSSESSKDMTLIL